MRGHGGGRRNAESKPLRQEQGFTGGMAKTSPAQFVREVRQELAKVTWPTRKELAVTTVSVFAMAIAMALFFFVVDQIIAWIVQLILGFGR
jgi:preprotein translocase subunit SecE